MAGRDLNAALFQEAQPAETWRQSLGLDALEQQHGLPAGLLTSVLRTESSGNPGAFSPKGAEGLFQFMPQTAKQYGINPYDPQQAAQAAAQELSMLYRKYQGNVPATLAGWNWGQGNLDEQGLRKAPPETQGFIQQVTGLLGPRQAEAASPQAPGRDLNKELFGDTPPASQPAAPVMPGQQPEPGMAATSPPAARTQELQPWTTGPMPPVLPVTDCKF